LNSPQNTGRKGRGKSKKNGEHSGACDSAGGALTFSVVENVPSASRQLLFLPNIAEIAVGTWRGAAAGAAIGAMAGLCTGLAFWEACWFTDSQSIGFGVSQFGMAIFGLFFISIWAAPLGAILGVVSGAISGLVAYGLTSPLVVPHSWLRLHGPHRRGMLYGAGIGMALAFALPAGAQLTSMEWPLIVDKSCPFFGNWLTCSLWMAPSALCLGGAVGVIVAAVRIRMGKTIALIALPFPFHRL
jgi:hypothetical protein